MFWWYIAIAVVIVIIGMVITAFWFFEEADYEPPKVILRGLALATFVSWGVALTWPLLLIFAVPALFIYGLVVAVKTRTNKTLDY